MTADAPPLKDASPGPLPPARPPGLELPRETYVLEIHRMTASIPVALTPGREVAAVLAWKPVGRGPEEYDVTFLTRVCG